MASHQIRTPLSGIQAASDTLIFAKAVPEPEQLLAAVSSAAAASGRGGRGIEIGVDDEGPGTPEGAAALVFEGYVSLDGGAGAGLGLPIARGLARSEGGEVSYRDDRLVFQIPACVATVSEER